MNQFRPEMAIAILGADAQMSRAVKRLAITRMVRHMSKAVLRRILGEFFTDDFIIELYRFH